MPGSAFVSAVNAVDWSALRSTYESGEVVRDIVLRLGSPDPAEVKWAWEQIGETVLHQGTVYPATAAAAPFLCQLALDAATPWRSQLTTELAFLSLGDDEPFARPAPPARFATGSGPASDSSSAGGEPLMRAWTWRWSPYRWRSRNGRVRRRRTPGGPYVSELDLGPTVYSPVLGATQLAARLRSGEDPENDAFSCVYSLLLNPAPSP